MRCRRRRIHLEDQDQRLEKQDTYPKLNCLLENFFAPSLSHTAIQFQFGCQGANCFCKTSFLNSTAVVLKPLKMTSHNIFFPSRSVCAQNYLKVYHLSNIPAVLPLLFINLSNFASQGTIVSLEADIQGSDSFQATAPRLDRQQTTHTKHSIIHNKETTSRTQKTRTSPEIFPSPRI